jgi:hypothetical protein
MGGYEDGVPFESGVAASTVIGQANILIAGTPPSAVKVRVRVIAPIGVLEAVDNLK